MRVAFLTALFALVVLPVGVVFAASGEFVPLAPIPLLNTSGEATLADYLNSVFLLLIAVAAMLAVLRIITGGFQYMTTEAVGTKGEARKTIQNAIIGLMLLLGVWVILATVNPTILNLDALKFSELKASDAVQGVIDQNQKDVDDARQKAEGLLGPGSLKSAEVNEETVQFNVVDVADLTSLEQSAYKATCYSHGGTVDRWNTITCTNPSGETRQSTKLRWWSYTEFVCEKEEAKEVKEKMSCVIPGN